MILFFSRFVLLIHNVKFEDVTLLGNWFTRDNFIVAEDAAEHSAKQSVQFLFPCAFGKSCLRNDPDSTIPLML